MKTVIIALSAAVLVAAAPAVHAQNVSSKSQHQHYRVFKKHPRTGYAWHAKHAKGLKAGYPGAFGYAPSEPRDYTLENSRQAGGGGGGGGSM